MEVLQAQTWQKTEPRQLELQPDAIRDGAKLAMSEETYTLRLPADRKPVKAVLRRSRSVASLEKVTDAIHKHSKLRVFRVCLSISI